MAAATPHADMSAGGRAGRWAQRYRDALLSWENAKPKRSGRACYRAYTQWFVPLVILVLIGLPISGREAIWNVDGLNQYYSFFLYEGQWIRGIVANLVAGNGLQIPLWEWHSGYGADVPTTFDVFLDPLNLVSAITPPAISEWVFQLLLVVRLYLAGLGFVFYCRTRGENRTGTVFGALLYALCGAGLVGVRWASGLHAFILFPVVLAGAERIIAGRKPWVFVASLTLLAIVSYYFTYMAVVLLVGYLAVRVVMVERPHLTVKRFLRWVGVFAGLVVVCLLLAGFALVPAAVALMGVERFVDGSTTVPLLYSLDYYLQLLSNFLSIGNVGSDTYQGFGGLAFLGCLALFAQRGRNTELKVVFIVLTAFFLFPIVGSFFNGMNYATNRWAWAYALCVALILVRATPQLLAPDAKTRRVLVAGTVVYGVLLLVPAMRTEANVAGYAALVAALAVVLAVRPSPARRAFMGCALALTLGVSSFYFLAASEGGQATGQVPLGAAYAKLTSDSADSIALEANDDSWWRYDAGAVSRSAHAPMNRIGNNSLVLGLNGIDFYNSVYSSWVDAFHTELAISDDNVNFWYTSLQSRTDPMALLGVKYYAYRNDGTDLKPYNYDEEVAQRTIAGIDYRLLSANESLPVGFAFDQALSKDDYLRLLPTERQQALLQAVVLDGEGQSGAVGAQRDGGAAFVDSSALQFQDKSVPYDIQSTAGVVVEDGRFIATGDGASVTLSFQGEANADTNVYFAGLGYQGMKPSEYLSDQEIESMSWYRKADLALRDFNYSTPGDYQLSLNSDATAYTGYVYNLMPANHMYGGKDTWLVNLGYSEDPATSITISFSWAGVYTFDDLQVITEKHDYLTDWLAQRSESVLQDAQLGCNQLTGWVDADVAKTLLITTAYSPGWTAYVDGQPTALLRGDTAFMAIDLPPGRHDVQLRYFTPGLAEGLAVTGVGIVALAVLALVSRRATRRKDEGA